MDANEQQALRDILDRIERTYGLAYPEAQSDVLATKLHRELSILGMSSFCEASRTLDRRPGTLLPQIMRALTIGETYFFRNEAQFEAVRLHILPNLVKCLHAMARLVIWSAGCATGEEAYSLAMWIRQNAPDLWPDRLRIVATDINSNFLEFAKTGRYRKHSFRQTDDATKRRFFTEDGDQYVIHESLRSVISFQEHNLVSADLPKGLTPGTVSLVFCRNVLIYFLRSRSAKVLDLFHQALTPDGFLILGHAESLNALRSWRVCYNPGTFYYQTPGPKPPSPSKLPKTPPPEPSRAKAAVIENKRPDPAKVIKVPDPTPARAQRTVEIPTDKQLGIARQMADTGDLEQAHRLLDDFILRDKTSTEGYFLAAMVADQMGKWDHARDSMKKALFLDKGLVLGHYFLAVLDERQGDMRSALRRYRTVSRQLKDKGRDFELPLGDGLTAGRLLELSEARKEELARHSEKPTDGLKRLT